MTKIKINNIIQTVSTNISKTAANFQKTKPMPLDSVSFSTKPLSNEQEFINLREKISPEMKTVLSNSEEACWDFYTDSTSENMDKMNIAEEKVNNFYDNKEVYAQLKKINDNGGIQEKHLSKQLKTLKI